MEKPVEFSKFYRLLNAAKEGEEGKSIELESILKQYETSEESVGPLHQLGETFIFVGIMKSFSFNIILRDTIWIVLALKYIGKNVIN